MPSPSPGGVAAVDVAAAGVVVVDVAVVDVALADDENPVARISAATIAAPVRLMCESGECTGSSDTWINIITVRNPGIWCVNSR